MQISLYVSVSNIFLPALKECSTSQILEHKNDVRSASSCFCIWVSALALGAVWVSHAVSIQCVLHPDWKVLNAGNSTGICWRLVADWSERQVPAVQGCKVSGYLSKNQKVQSHKSGTKDVWGELLLCGNGLAQHLGLSLTQGSSGRKSVLCRVTSAKVVS